eukprot:UN02295
MNEHYYIYDIIREIYAFGYILIVWKVVFYLFSCWGDLSFIQCFLSYSTSI